MSGEGWGGGGGDGVRGRNGDARVSLQVFMPHQWLEGNLPVSARCLVCDKNCGSVRRLQDWRCLWCKAIVSLAAALISRLDRGLRLAGALSPRALALA